MTEGKEGHVLHQPPVERMRHYLRAIGQGPKNCRDLTRDEALDALSLILEQQATPAQAGALLLVERFKGESAEELLGFADAIRGCARTIRPRVQGLLDIGSPYDGRKRSIVVSPAASLVAAAAGVPVVMHGENGMPPKHGVTVGEVLEALGLDVDAEPQEVERSLEEAGFGYMRSARFLPALFALKGLREELALRTHINTIEKLYNLAGADYSLIGLTHLPYLEKMLEAAKGMGFRRIMVLQGIEGNEDAPTSRPCRVFEFREGKTSEYRLNAQDYGLVPASAEEMAASDVARSVETSLQVLRGEKGAHRDLIIFNAAIRIYLAERAPTLDDAVALAARAIDSGAAWGKLTALRERAARRSGV